MYLNLLRLWGLRVPLAMLLAWVVALGPTGIWYAMFVSNIVTAGIGFWLLRTGRWMRRLELGTKQIS